ncbi:hypothetical protein AKJ18_02970 [Vibrio xuii]|nr:hypothetical protein AKJ18_02970 [Vibrio xuii]
MANLQVCAVFNSMTRIYVVCLEKRKDPRYATNLKHVRSYVEQRLSKLWTILRSLKISPELIGQVFASKVFRYKKTAVTAVFY